LIENDLQMGNDNARKGKLLKKPSHKSSAFGKSGWWDIPVCGYVMSA